jgi:hypothetical protein
MYTNLTVEYAEQRRADLFAASARDRRAHEAAPAPTPTHGHHLRSVLFLQRAFVVR